MSNQQKSNFALAAHFFCTFLCRCFARLQRETSRNFLRWCYTRRFATTIFSATKRCNIVRHCLEQLQHCSNIATLSCAKNRRCESYRVTSPLVTRFMEEMQYVFSSTFFHCRSFSPCIGGHEHFLFSHCRYKIVMLFFQQKKCLLCCLSLSLSPFFSLSFNGLPPTFAFSLSFFSSIFQICGHDN